MKSFSRNGKRVKTTQVVMPRMSSERFVVFINIIMSIIYFFFVLRFLTSTRNIKMKLKSFEFVVLVKMFQYVS